jgi:hypothetical protein
VQGSETDGQLGSEASAGVDRSAGWDGYLDHHPGQPNSTRGDVEPADYNTEFLESLTKIAKKLRKAFKEVASD